MNARRQVPILFVSDSVSEKTGLARITRDLCGLLSASPDWRVGSLGLGGNTARSLPWAQYQVNERKGEWGWGDLPGVWRDFAGQDRGVVMTVWDLTRVHWLARPQYCGDPALQKWLQERHFDLWGYLPIDASGPGGKLSSIAADALYGFSRLLAYTKWAKGVVEATLSGAPADLDWMPHGLDFAVWGLDDREQAKKAFYPFLHDNERLIGVVGTNQPRKDWGLMAQTCRMIAEQRTDVKFWWHSDLPQRHWSFPALLADFGLQTRVHVTYDLTPSQLRAAYNACEVTLHPGLGEGFGYPIFESLACGTPVVHGNYGGGADVLGGCGFSEALVQPTGYRVEGVHNQVRPVFNPGAWSEKARAALEEEPDREGLKASVAHLDWENLRPLWLRWFDEGARCL